MQGHILAPYTERTKKLLEVNKNKYDGINDDREIASVWTEAIQDAEGGSSGNSDISRRGRSGADDRLLGASSERNTSRDNERIWTNPRTEEEYHEIVNKVREMLGLEPVDYSKGKFLRELDTEYLSAVKRGDTETVQKMVDEAANKTRGAPDGKASREKPDIFHIAKSELTILFISKTS